jgi:CDP-glucose 4,6-dehydratase
MREPLPFDGIYRGTRVLVTGHTGFKGSWLTYWLLNMGAEVTGYALEPETTPALFDTLALGRQMDSRIADIRDLETLSETVTACRPEFVFHLAAQPLVRRSYAEPVYTLAANVMGTANVLEAVRACEDTRVLVNVTTDKVYENPESGTPFLETDRLGGHDPYSASKACSEIVTAAYRDSFFAPEPGRAAVVTARAGNVVGGGDWAEDRIVPDVVRALSDGVAVRVRNPRAVRPWQHVLEPLAGYLTLAAHLDGREDAHAIRAVNFGPDTADSYTVREVVERAIACWGSGEWTADEADGQPHEAGVLRLDISKAHEALGWSPVWGFEETIDRTVDWYRRYNDDPSRAAELCLADIEAYAGATSGIV